MVRGGIPLGFKSALWQILSGSIHLMSITDKSYYQSLVDKQEINWNTKEAKGSTMADMKQIEKDLIRSLPKFQYFQKSNEGIGALRNVLRAYALHNPAIGYCQSMNIVTGSLLLFLEEEEAFYVLVSIISKVPEYYVRELLGSTVDTRIFNDLIAEKLPTLSEHFQKNFIDLTLVALSWFLCLYIDRIPWEAALRVMDCFIAEGPNILLQMGLAILSTHEEQLLKLDNIVSVKELLDTAQFDCTALCKLAFEELQVDHEDMNARRNYHKYRALQELHKRNNTNIFGSIIKKTKFNQSRVEQYYEEFKSAISIDSTAFSLHFDDFRGVFGSMVKWWPVDFTEFEKLFDLFDQHKDEVITFTEYMLGLDIIMHGSMIQHQQLVFGLYSENDHLSRTLLYQKALPLLSLLNYYRDADLNGQEKDDAFFPLFEFKPEEGEEMLDFGAFRTTSLAILKIEK
uniref:Rab-GAP TBC domain-containing protein n=1 Tax=Arcella intermedia TaxID=1963864 RepID=A0A6B2L3I3_9EUKA